MQELFFLKTLENKKEYRRHMTAFPGSPRLLKGAIIGLDPVNPLASMIVFQYNPDTMTRRLDARSMGGEGGDRSEAFRLTGPPKETITLSIELDAADQLEEGHPLAVASGSQPRSIRPGDADLSQEREVIADAALAQFGIIEIIPPEAPLALFIWGPTRVLPVRVTSFSITEEAYDTLLESHPCQGGSEPVRAQLRGPEDDPPRLQPLSGPPDHQGGHGHHECVQHPEYRFILEAILR